MKIPSSHVISVSSVKDTRRANGQEGWIQYFFQRVWFFFFYYTKTLKIFHKKYRIEKK